MTFTETPGMAALLVSWTTPVMLPRSDCARQTAGTARAAAASRITNERRIAINADRDPSLPCRRLQHRPALAMGEVVVCFHALIPYCSRSFGSALRAEISRGRSPRQVYTT